MSRNEQGDPAGRLLEIKRDVMSYLVEHPDAKDTAEGIFQWWMLDAMQGMRITDLVQALEELLQEGWITCSSFGGTTVYGLERARREDVVRWLEN